MLGQKKTLNGILSGFQSMAAVRAKILDLIEG